MGHTVGGSISQWKQSHRMGKAGLNAVASLQGQSVAGSCFLALVQGRPGWEEPHRRRKSWKSLLKVVPSGEKWSDAITFYVEAAHPSR